MKTGLFFLNLFHFTCAIHAQSNKVDTLVNNRQDLNTSKMHVNPRDKKVGLGLAISGIIEITAGTILYSNGTKNNVEFTGYVTEVVGGIVTIVIGSLSFITGSILTTHEMVKANKIKKINLQSKGNTIGLVYHF